jgi:aryl-alcohol dehydrogenase
VTVTAAVVEAKDAPFVLEELDIESPRAGELLVEIDAVGVCHTDLSVRAQLLATPLPAVLGHEGTGRVVAVGDGVTRAAVGDRVALSFDSCGECGSCSHGHPSICTAIGERNFGAARADGSSALSRAGGGHVHSHFFGQSSFATMSIASERSVARIPDDIPSEVVAGFGCGFQTGAGTVMNALRPEVGSSIAVFGVGGVGMAALFAAKIVGCHRLVAVDVNPERLALAAELAGAETLDATRTDPAEALTMSVDYAIECSGVPACLPQALDAVVPGGTVAVVGAPPLGTTAPIDVNELMSVSRTIRGVVEGDSISHEFIPRLVEEWRRGRFPVDRLVTAYDFDQINEAAAAAERGEVVKPVLWVR